MMRLFIAVLTVGLLFVACADRQDEAEKLGQEVVEQEADSVTMSPGATPEGDLAVVDESAADAAAAPIEPEPTFEVPSGDGFTVQVASCPNREYGLHLVEVYRKRGYEPYMINYTDGGESFHRVRIGAFESFAEAEALKAELLDKYSLETWIDNKTE